MSTFIDADAAPVRDAYRSFAGLLDLANDESVAVMAVNAGALNPAKLEQIARERLVMRQRARHEADLVATSQRGPGKR